MELDELRAEVSRLANALEEASCDKIKVSFAIFPLFIADNSELFHFRQPSMGYRFWMKSSSLKLNFLSYKRTLIQQKQKLKQRKR